MRISFLVKSLYVEASRLREQGLAGRIARTLSSMQQVIAGKKATAECDGGAQREADSTEKQQVKEQLEQHHEGPSENTPFRPPF